MDTFVREFVVFRPAARQYVNQILEMSMLTTNPLSLFLLLAGALFLQLVHAQDPSVSPNGQYTTISKSPPPGSAKPIPAGFVSYSIEFAYFPDFAGNKSNPNQYSYALLNNIATYQGVNPIIRVGGKTQ